MTPADPHAALPRRSPRLDPLFESVYADLRRLARHLRNGRAGETLRTTSLVHEAYLKLARSSCRRFDDERHFIRVAARAMRQLMLDAAEARRALKRGGGATPVAITGNHPDRSVDPGTLLDLDRALDRLGAFDSRAARVVELRFYAGLTVAETAAVLEISEPTVKRDWRTARAWLQQELRGR